MNYILLSYCVYLVATITLTIWVAKALFKNGKVFLLDIFHGNKDIADSVNNLLLVGFYLINIGYAVYTLQIHDDVLNWKDVFEKLSMKIGLIILILGAMHFFNLYIFFTLRKKAMQNSFYKNIATPKI